MPQPQFDFSAIDDLYQDIILDHYRARRNARKVENPTIANEGNNPFCGDDVAVQLKLDDEGKIVAVGNQGQGCSISQASASLMSEVIKGTTLDEAHEVAEVFRRMMQGKELSPDEMERLQDTEALQGVRQFPIRIKCALLAWLTLEEGIERHQQQSR